jgi:hypothetical protein
VCAFAVPMSSFEFRVSRILQNRFGADSNFFFFVETNLKNSI